MVECSYENTTRQGVIILMGSNCRFGRFLGPLQTCLNLPVVNLFPEEEGSGYSLDTAPTH